MTDVEVAVRDFARAESRRRAMYYYRVGLAASGQNPRLPVYFAIASRRHFASAWGVTAFAQAARG